jgi:hypothetical protein
MITIKCQKKCSHSGTADHIPAELSSAAVSSAETEMEHDFPEDFLEHLAQSQNCV